MAQQIEQGDYIFYQDATVGGPPVLWSWLFPGGTPTGSSNQNPIVRYLAPNSLGYNVTLYVEDTYSIYSSKTENNAIVVVPENLSSISLSASTANATLSETVLYTVAGPTGKLSYYDWDLPGTGGFTGPTSQTQSLTVNSWLDLTGSDAGSFFSIASLDASVTYFSVTGNSLTVTTPINFIKSGYFESFNLLSATGAFPSPTTQYTQAINTVTQTSSIGLGGGGYVWLFGQPYYPNAIENLSSRVQGETVDFWSCSKDFAFPFGSIDAGKLENLQFVASKQAFDVLGVSPTGWESLSRYTVGNYMFPYDLSTYFNSSFYLADVNSLVTGTPISNNGYSSFNSLFLNDAYYASQSSASMSARYPSVQPAAFLLNLDGAAGASGSPGLQCIPSPTLVGGTVTLTLTVQYSTNGKISGYNPASDNVININFSPPGNSPDASLFFAQDTIGGSGFVSLINAALTSAGLASNIEAMASPSFCWSPALYELTTGQYFQGCKIVIKDVVDPGNPHLKIIRVRVQGNSGSWNPPYNLYTVTGNAGSGSWLCFADEDISNPYQEYDTQSLPFRGFKFRGNT
jgi:hypothetical protein